MQCSGLMMSLCLDIERCKISNLVLPSGDREAKLSSSRKVQGFLEATYARQEDYVSEDFLVRPGNCAAVPWDKSMTSLTLNLFVLEGIETREIGSCSWEPSFLLKLQAVINARSQESSMVDAVLPIKKGSNKIGKISGRFSIVGTNLYEAPPGDEEAGDVYERMDGATLAAGLQAPLPAFEFVPMTKAIDWDRLHYMDLNSIIAAGSRKAHHLEAAADDLCFGGLALEDDAEADPALLNAVGLQQLCLQYIRRCNSHLHDRAGLIETTLCAFTDEEQHLDLQIGRLKARNRAYARESSSLDELQANYMAVLESVNPELYRQYVKSREKGVEAEEAERAARIAQEKKAALLADERAIKLRQVEKWHETGKDGIEASFERGKGEGEPEPPLASPTGQGARGRHSNTPGGGVRVIPAQIPKLPGATLQSSGNSMMASIVRSPSYENVRRASLIMMGVGRSGEATPTGGLGAVDSVRSFSNSGSRTPTEVASSASRFTHVTSVDENDDFTPLGALREGDPPSPLPGNVPALDVVLAGSPLTSPADTPSGGVRKALTSSLSVTVGRGPGPRSPVLPLHAASKPRNDSSSDKETMRDSAGKIPVPAWASAQPLQGLTSSMASAMSVDSLAAEAQAASSSGNENTKKSFPVAGGVGIKAVHPKTAEVMTGDDASLSNKVEVSANEAGSSSKPPLPLWAEAQAASGTGTSIAAAGVGVASSIQSAMSVDSLARTNDNKPQTTIISRSPAVPSEDSPSSSRSDSDDPSDVTGRGSAPALRSPTPSPAPTTVLSPDDNFADAEAQAMAEHVASKEENDDKKEGKDGDITDDDVAVPVLDISAPSPPSIAASSSAALVIPGARAEKKTDGELEDLDDFVHDFGDSDEFTMSSPSGAVNREAKGDKGESKAASDKKGGEPESSPRSGPAQEAGGKGPVSPVQRGESLDNKGTGDGAEGKGGSLGVNHEEYHEPIDVSYSVDNVATEVSYVDRSYQSAVYGGDATPLEMSNGHNSYFNDSDVMGRSQEDYYDSFEAKAVSPSPADAKQGTRSPLYDSGGRGRDSLGIAASKSQNSGDLGIAGNSYYEEGGSGFISSTDPGDESEEPVLFGMRREGGKNEAQATSASGHGDMKRGIMSYLRSPHDAKGGVKARSDVAGSTTLRLSADSDEEYVADFDEAADNEEDDVLIGTKTVNRSQLGLGRSSEDSSQAEITPAGGAHNPRTLGAESSVSGSALTLGSTANTKSMDQLKGLLGSSSKSSSAREVTSASAFSAPPPEDDDAMLRLGRASTDVVNAGGAMDLFVSSVFVDEATKGRMGSVQLQVFFMSEHSSSSDSYLFPSQSGGGGRMKMLPVNFSMHMLASEKVLNDLSDEIQMEEEGFSFSVLVQDGTTGENVGRASVNLWRMIEDSCNILRQEVDIVSVSTSAGAVIGSIIIDVRGYSMLKAAAP